MKQIDKMPCIVKYSIITHYDKTPTFSSGLKMPKAATDGTAKSHLRRMVSNDDPVETGAKFDCRYHQRRPH